MNRARIERSLVVFLFVAVLVVFSFAKRDSQKLDEMYAASKQQKDLKLVQLKPTRTVPTQ